MIILSHDDKSAAVRLSTDELRAVNNALNEVCNGIHFGDAEFQTRLGQPREALNELLEEIGALLESQK